MTELLASPRSSGSNDRPIVGATPRTERKLGDTDRSDTLSGPSGPLSDVSDVLYSAIPRYDLVRDCQSRKSAYETPNRWMLLSGLVAQSETSSSSRGKGSGRMS